ncbi:hypothetical protein L227DRAFT_615235 [Lentinus tigrinus ALCF2SS1-6]|uniref:DUF6533 domain-containing protein n=1 Tax=Lentinus tigrinus ALCF2SS1-6 TaxID=1328759 RepID=A0A5C2RX85_9APHY|nr:hypothetical protein L227DRAFT_615235 [Lentinus tigrinus ALCF2SS1-6]
MSSPEAAQLIDFYSSMLSGTYIGLVPIVFLLYDYFLTLGREVRLFWTGTLTGASILFFSLRYATLLYEVLDIVEGENASSLCRAFVALELTASVADSCNLIAQAFNVVNFLRFVPIALFSAMRAYALSSNYVLSAIIFLLSLTPFVVNFIQYGQGIRGSMLPVGNCEAQINVTPVETIMSVSLYIFMGVMLTWNADRITVPVVSRGGLIIADFLLILVTWRTLVKTSVLPRFSFEKAHKSLTTIMFWNGTIYFVVLFVLNVLHMTFTLTSIFGLGKSLIAVFTDPITTILISRFLLDLQHANRQDVQLGSDDHIQQTSTPQGSLAFARTLGSINSTITSGADWDSGVLSDEE